MAETMTMERAFAAAARAFSQAGVEMPVLDARLLVCRATGLTHEAFVAQSARPLEAEAAARLEEYVARRLRREPVSRIMGEREFYGRRFLLDASALDPRPDTETLIETALGLVDANGWRQRKLKLLDLGTGTGCVLLTLLAELPYAEGIATDLSQAALALASANAHRLGVEARAAFIATDWLDGVRGTFDLMLSNPPYIPAGKIAGLSPEVAGYDPRLALDGGADGLDPYRRIAAGALERLHPEGSLIVEIGAGQGESVSALFREGGLAAGDEAVRRDLAGRPRCVVARRVPERPRKIGLEKHDVRARFRGGNEYIWPAPSRRGRLHGNKSDIGRTSIDRLG
jgi:release factor glutamine methyltransferase